MKDTNNEDLILYYAFKEFLCDHPMITVKDVSNKRFLNDDKELEVNLMDGKTIVYDLLSGVSRTISKTDTCTKKLPKDENEWCIEFSRRLHHKAKIYGWSQKSLADVTGISQYSICRYMQGDVIPSAYNLMLLSKALGCSLEYLAVCDE